MLEIVSAERLYAVDAELLGTDAGRIELRLGPRLRLAVSPTAGLPPGLEGTADAVAR